ncbi:unnamed protein product [Rhizoctonia solani]|uniref:Methyltransferase type 12 domain-containing protein n=1 Tax=Rhizoctonia solani TaxID=456999 RepID=A0A8H3ARA0_9AGAM|nr:unnamed protein product [Rhizoctonia solani]
MSEAISHSHTHADNGASHHGHGHHAPGGLKEANRQFFDGLAHSHDGGYENIPIAQPMADKGSAAILDAFPFDKRHTVVMDFACGVGMISQRLVSHSKSIIGVDISSKSVDFYNERAAKQGVPPEQMKALCADLTERGKAENDAFGGVEFDVIVCSAAYHHFDDINQMTKVLASYLKPGTGTLIIIDIMESPEAARALSSHGHIVAYTRGFSEELIQSAFVDAGGLQDFSFKPVFQMDWHGTDTSLFIAKGVRPSL